MDILGAVLLMLFWFQSSVGGHGTSRGLGTLKNIPPTVVTTTSLWPSSQTPGTIDFDGSSDDLELGVKWFADTPGFVNAIRFYKSPLNTGTHTGTLWTIGGLLLSTVTFANESSSGWQQQDLPTPVAVCGTTHYLASYHDVAGHWSGDRPYFGSQYNNPPLHALADGADGGNGVYNFPGHAFPASSFGATNYWVDIAFQASASAVAVSSLSPASGANGTSVAIVGCNFTAGATATMGGTAATVIFNSATSLTLTAPTHVNGVVDVAVTVGSQTTTFPASFTYTNAGLAPTVASVSPTTSSTSGGGTLTVNGTGFIGGTTVTVGGNTCTSPSITSSSLMTCTLPAGTAGAKNVVATNANGVGTCSGCFTYITTGALLTGQIPSNFTVPAGWTTVITQNFETGSIGGNEIIAGTIINNAAACHTGNRCLSATYSHDQDALDWVVKQGVANSREIYFSWYDKSSSTQRFNDELFLARPYLYLTNENGPLVQEEIVDLFSYTDCGTDGFNSAIAYLLLEPQAPNADQGIGVSHAFHGPCTNFAPLGQYIQWEVHFKSNTPTNPTLASDGVFEVFRNGASIFRLDSTDPNSKGNFNGLNDMIGQGLEIGGLYTKLIWLNSGVCGNFAGQGTPVRMSPSSFACSQCTAAIIPAHPQCPVPNFDRTIDDIIVLKKP